MQVLKKCNQGRLMFMKDYYHVQIAAVETVLRIYQGDGTMESHKFELHTIYKGKSPEKEFVEKELLIPKRFRKRSKRDNLYIELG
jgi:hypothetical protein